MNNVNKWLDIAENRALESKCLRRKYGSVIVKDDEILSIGINDVPLGRKSCSDLGHCVRSKFNIARGTRYELCRSVHSELDAIIKVSRSQYNDTKNSELYLVGLESDGSYVMNTEPCIMCKKAIINAGISKVYCRIDKNTYREFDTNDWIINDTTENCTDTYIVSDN